MRVGIDIVEVGRVKAALDRHGSRFLERIFTDEEILSVKDRKRIDESVAARFAAKEAFMKAQGRRYPWRAIEVLKAGDRPFIRFLERRFDGVSISHERRYAVAVVMIEER